MAQKGQVGQKPETSGSESMHKGAAQGQQNKPMQQGKPAQEQQGKPVQGREQERSQEKSEYFKKNK